MSWTAGRNLLSGLQEPQQEVWHADGRAGEYEGVKKCAKQMDEIDSWKKSLSSLERTSTRCVLCRWRAGEYEEVLRAVQQESGQEVHQVDG